MRILMISDVYFPRINGVSTSIQTFRQYFLDQGHEVTLIAPAYPQDWPDDDDTIRIPSSRVLFDPEDRLMHRNRIDALEDELREREYDLVHIQTPFVAHYSGKSLAHKLGIPVIESYHTFFEEYLYNYIRLLPKGMLRFVARTFTRLQCNRIDSLVVPSTAMHQVLIGYGVRTPASIIPTGIRPEQFANATGGRFRYEHGIEKDRPVLVHVGRIAHEKNIDFLLHALALITLQVRDILLVIAGDGPAVNHLVRLATRLGLQDNTLFVGYLRRDGELQDCYAAGDAFVFASRTETQGLVLLEAMACGVPVVSTAVMGTRDILEPERGALVAEEDHRHFAEQVIRLVTNRALRQSLSVDALCYVNRWSAGYQADRMLHHYQAVIELHATGRSASRDEPGMEMAGNEVPSGKTGS